MRLGIDRAASLDPPKSYASRMALLLALVALLVGGSIAVIVVLVRAANKNQAASTTARNRFREMAMRATGKSADAAFAAVHGKRAVACALSWPSKNSPPVYTLSLSIAGDAGSMEGGAGAYRADPRRRVDHRPKMMFRRETGRDRFGKAIKLNREFETGDRDFDARVYIESDAKDDALREVLADPRARAALARLLDRGCQQVLLHENACDIKIKITNPKAEHLEAYREMLADLAEIADTLPAFSGAVERKFWTFGAKVVTPAIVLLAVGGIGWAIANTNYPTVTNDLQGVGALFGLAAWCALVPVAGFLLRGRSNSFRLFMVVICTQLFALPFTANAILQTSNAALDDAKVAHHVTTVKRMFTTSGKNSTYYHLVLSSWRRDLKEVEVQVSYNQYENLAVGSKVPIDTKPGAFGWEWIVRVD